MVALLDDDDELEEEEDAAGTALRGNDGAAVPSKYVVTARSTLY